MSIAACLTTGTDNYETPEDVFARYAARYSFVLDAAADATNHKCDTWFGPGGVEEDALTADWVPYLMRGDIWLNPPYSRGLQPAFVDKAAREAHRADMGSVVCLLPSRTDTAIFHDFLWNLPRVHVTFLRGRIKFLLNGQPVLDKAGRPVGAPFPSMIVEFGPCA